MYEPGSWFVDRDASGYDAEQLKAFRALATDLVASGAASRAAISLEAAPPAPTMPTAPAV